VSTRSYDSSLRARRPLPQLTENRQRRHLSGSVPKGREFLAWWPEKRAFTQQSTLSNQHDVLGVGNFARGSLKRDLWCGGQPGAGLASHRGGERGGQAVAEPGLGTDLWDRVPGRPVCEDAA